MKLISLPRGDHFAPEASAPGTAAVVVPPVAARWRHGFELLVVVVLDVAVPAVDDGRAEARARQRRQRRQR